MIISHKYKFIFIKTAKTAGTSIEIFLSQHCGENDIVTPIFPHIEPHVARNYSGIWNPSKEIIYKRGRGVWSTIEQLLKRNKFHNHIPAWLVKCRIPDKMWKNYFKFCVERNPWDKTLSHYHMLNDRAGGNMSFEEYIERGNFCLNYSKYTDSKNNILVDKIIKYESLAEELHQVFNNLGIPFDGTLGVRAKSEHRKDRTPYQDVLTSKQRTLIIKAFAKEIELHGFRY